MEIAVSIAAVSHTASTNLDELGSIKSLLIHGASGGVGSIAVQLAVERGIEVIGTSSKRNLDYLTSLGTIAVEYGDVLKEHIKAIHPEPLDASVDMVGTEEATQASSATVKSVGKFASTVGNPTSANDVILIRTKFAPQFVLPP